MFAVGALQQVRRHCAGQQQVGFRRRTRRFRGEQLSHMYDKANTYAWPHAGGSPVAFPDERAERSGVVIRTD